MLMALLSNDMLLRTRGRLLRTPRGGQRSMKHKTLFLVKDIELTSSNLYLPTLYEQTPNVLHSVTSLLVSVHSTGNCLAVTMARNEQVTVVSRLFSPNFKVRISPHLLGKFASQPTPTQVRRTSDLPQTNHIQTSSDTHPVRNPDILDMDSGIPDHATLLLSPSTCANPDLTEIILLWLHIMAVGSKLST